MSRDRGYFPVGQSILRHVHAQRSVGLLYGQRALMLGAFQPLAFIGTTQRSKAHRTPFRRLKHTAEMFEAVFFGSCDEADAALAFTAKLHRRVVGEIPSVVGPYPAGTPYSATDPALMMWVVVPMFDSARVLFELLVRPLDESEVEQLWQEYLLFGELFGMPRDAAPATTVELERWWSEQFAREEVLLTEHARAVGRSIAYKMPLPPGAKQALAPGQLVLTGSLPDFVRKAYGLQWATSHQAAFAALTVAVRATRPLVPARVREGSCMPLYEIVEAAERTQLRTGRRAMDISDDVRRRARQDLDTERDKTRATTG